MPLHVSPKRVLVWFLGISLFLALLSCLSDIAFLAGRRNQLGLRILIQMDAERNIPTFWSAFQLAVATLMLLLTGNQARSVRPEESGYWYALAGIFAVLTLDEDMQLHEHTAVWVRATLPATANLKGFAWTVGYLLVVPLVASPFLRFWYRLPTPTRNTCLLAAICFVGGALGIELLGAYSMLTWGKESPQYFGASIVEETLEMTGISLLIYSCSDLIARRGGLFLGP
ncbi:MAG: hypothetical protein H6993_01965 [Pseudomonadales bacterium]|nr:hypothetical protein [Pseudomonadales bacterium]